MKRYFLLTMAGAVLLSGCGAASFEEAYFVDREFGLASQAAWDQQIAYPGRVIDAVPTGREGIIAEEIIDVHVSTFGEKPTKMDGFSLEMD